MYVHPFEYCVSRHGQLTFTLARRLRWVHTFASNERWKEEVIRTKEEIRRIGAWFNHQSRVFMDRASKPANDESWAMRGLSALQHELARSWRKRMDELPANVLGHIVNRTAEDNNPIRG
jgi:hypothetical protein